MSGKIISQLWLKMFWLSLSDLHTKNALKASHSECEHQEERGLLAMFSWVKLIMALWNLYSWQGKYGKFYKRFKNKTNKKKNPLHSRPRKSHSSHLGPSITFSFRLKEQNWVWVKTDPFKTNRDGPDFSVSRVPSSTHLFYMLLFI